MPLQRIGVLGAGNIGIGVASDLVLHGLTAVVVDLSAEILDRAQTAVLQNVRSAPLLSKTLPRVTADEARARLVLTQDIDAMGDCDFIVENVTEDWDVKRRLYAELDRIAAADVCFGANTSCIPITRIGGATRRPEKVVGVHFMNPVHLTPTVELIRGFHTADRTVDTLRTLLGMMRKDAIVVRDMPGFVSNRISHLFMNEAAFVLQDGVADAASIDAIFKKCFGHKMGPLETADLVGLDTVVDSLHVLYESYQDPKYRCCPLLRQLVDAGHLGRKTGRGFHVYPTG